MVTLELPLTADAAALRHINATAVLRAERAGRIEDGVPMIVEWDDTAAPVPTTAEIEAAVAEAEAEQKRRALREVALQTAAEMVASLVLADVENGKLTRVEDVKNSTKYRVSRP